MTATPPIARLIDADFRVVFNVDGTPSRLIDGHGAAMLDFNAIAAALAAAEPLADLLLNYSTNADLVAAAFEPTVNSVAPVVTPAVATTGTVLSSTTGTWDHNPISFTYQWYADAAPIGGATASTYAVLIGDLDADITCKVAATNLAGAASAVESNAVTPAAE